MPLTDLKQLERDIYELTNGASNESLPKWMGENMTYDQLKRYFDILAETFDDGLNEVGWMMAIHTCPYVARFLALRRVFNESQRENET